PGRTPCRPNRAHFGATFGPEQAFWRDVRATMHSGLHPAGKRCLVTCRKVRCVETCGAGGISRQRLGMVQPTNGNVVTVLDGRSGNYSARPVRAGAPPSADGPQTVPSPLAKLPRAREG